MKVAPDGRIVARWGTLGSGEVQFAQPADIAVDTKGDIYVLDGGNRRVQKLDAKGRFVRSWTVPHEPVSPAAFSSIAVGADRIYVAESNTSKVEMYTLDGGFVLSWVAPEQTRASSGS